MLTKVHLKMFGFFIVFALSLLSATAFGQTVLINPTQGGGFELGPTFADNGWNVSNSANNPWFLGSSGVGAPIAGNSAYVSNNSGVSPNYSNTSPCINYFWRDVTVPAGETKIKLTFNWNSTGETNWDVWQVLTAPITTTPASTITYPGSGNIVPTGLTGATAIAMSAPSVGVQTATIFLPASLAGTTFRLIFAWKSDTSAGTNPPATLDNISLTSQVPGTFISITSGIWTNPLTWDANDVPSPVDNVTVTTGHIVDLDQNNLGANNLIVFGTLNYAVAATRFDVFGNLTVNASGVFNVYNLTTGKQLYIKGNLINNGVLHTSVGFTYLRFNGSVPQTVSGIGTFGTLNASNMANSVYYLYFENTSTIYPNIVWNVNNVAAQLIYFSGVGFNSRVDLLNNKLINGDVVGTTFTAGSVTAAVGTGILPGGKYSRIWSAASTGTAITANAIPTTTTSLYPFTTLTGEDRRMWIQRVNAAGAANATGATAGQLAVVHANTTGVVGGLSVNDAGYTINNRSNANWTVSDEGTGCSNSFYRVCTNAGGIYTSIPLNMNARLMKIASVVGTHQNGGATPVPFSQRTAIAQADMLTTYYIGFGDADYVPFPPGAITQSAAVPNCAAGTQLSATGTPFQNTAWYWQTSATGTDISVPYTGAYSVFANGTYYLRTFMTTGLQTDVNAWSTAVSYAVTNMPIATAPPAPVADANPACAPAGSTLSMVAPPANVTYYWQGNTLNGSSTALPASVSYNAATTGTYYVSAFDAVTSCWSFTTPLAVVVDNLIPFDPTVTIPVVNICNGATSALIEASALTQTTGSLTAATASGNGCGGGAMFDVAAQAIPITINTVDIKSTTASGTLNVYYKVGTYFGSQTNAAAWTLLGTATFSGTAQTMVNVDITDLTIPANTTYGIYLNYAAAYTNVTGPTTYSNADVSLTVGAGLCSAFGGVNANRAFNGAINYTAGFNADVAWFPSATGGTQLGVGTPFEGYGTSVLPNSLTNGSYAFYAAGKAGGCYSVNRSLVTVNVTPVLVSLSPINASCNGNNNGSFSVATVLCGTAPFLFSVDGGVFGAIPTDLIAGTYSVVVQDAGGLLSSPISLVVGQPAPPVLTFVDATYFTADISWTTTGNETSWNIEYGPVGFTPGSGTTVVATASPYTLTGLAAETAYDVYITTICGPNPQASAVLEITTNFGFSTFDNSCGPGFQDISGTGTGLNLADDASTTINLTSPVSYQGNSGSTITVSNNGFISFPGVTLNVWNNDWDAEEGNVFWQETTIGGDDYLIVEWYRRPRFSGVIGQNVTFEVLMNKNTSEVYYIYDDVVVGGTQASNDYGAQGTISAVGPLGTATVSVSNAAYLTANSCVHFYNALCPNPINLTSLIFQEEVILDWGTGLYGETEWTIIYGPAGFDPATGGTTVTSANSDIDIINLTQLTEYDVYIYSECALDDLTSPGLLFSFQTLPFCSDPSGITTTTAVDSLYSAWNWVETGALYPATGFNIQYGMTGFDLYAGTVVNANNNLSDTTFDAGFLAGGVYQVYVQAVCSADTSNYVGPFTFIMPLSNDSVCGAEMLAVDGSVYYFNNVGATAQVGEAALITGTNPAGYNATDLAVMTWGSPAVEGSNWYSFIAPTSGSIRFSGLDENAFLSQIAVYALTDCGDFTTFELMGASDQVDLGVTTKLAPNFTLCGLTAGETYYVLHDAWSNGLGGAATFGQYSIKMTPIDLEAGSYVSMLDVCAGNSIVLFDGITGYQDGGTWLAELASVGTGIADSLFNSAGLSYQVHNFEYRVTDGCAYDSIATQVQIFPPSNAGPDGSLTVCRNEPFELVAGLTGTVDLDGTWLNPSSVALPGSTTTASNLPGQYNFVYITGNGVCPDDTATVLVDVLTTCDWNNVDEMYFATMELLPNPTNGLVYITNQGSSEVFHYEITDIDGRVIATKKSAINGTSVTEINLNGKVTGMYMIRVYNDNAEKIFRVILQ
jgi:hypothetical protein